MMSATTFPTRTLCQRTWPHGSGSRRVPAPHRESEAGTDAHRPCRHRRRREHLRAPRHVRPRNRAVGAQQGVAEWNRSDRKPCLAGTMEAEGSNDAKFGLLSQRGEQLATAMRPQPQISSVHHPSGESLERSLRPRPLFRKAQNLVRPCCRLAVNDLPFVVNARRREREVRA